MESGYASVEPEAGCCGEVGGVGVQFEEDSDVVAAGLVDEVVEIVEGAVDGIKRLSVCGVGLEGGEEEGVDAEGVDVVQTLADTVKSAAVGGAEVDGVYFIDDGTFPPDVGGDTGAGPTGTSENLCFAG